MIKLRNIDKYFKNKSRKTFVLNNISLDIEIGEFISIMGPSGAGKSTLLNIIGMLEEPNDGEYFFVDNEVHNIKEKLRIQLYREEIGFVFQSYHLIDEMTVYENIEMPLLYQNIKASERKSMVSDMLDKFNIVAKKDLFPNQLSGGQQQLVGIIRAIIAKPTLLLADEPTGNLNSKQGKEIMELFKKLNKEGTTIIQVTHSEEKAEYGSRIINLEDGKIV